MAKPLSEDLRSRVVAAVDGGMSRRAAAERFGVAASTAIRWARAWRAEGRAAALPMGGDLRSRRIEAHRDAILAAVEAEVDITLVELAALLRREHGVAFAPSTVWRFLDRQALAVKKTRAAKPAGRPAAPKRPNTRPDHVESGCAGCAPCVSVRAGCGGHAIAPG